MTTPTLERHYTTRAASDLTGFPLRLVREAAGTTGLPSVRFGPKGRHRIAHSDLMAWVARHRTQVQTEKVQVSVVVAKPARRRPPTNDNAFDDLIAPGSRLYSR